MMTTMKTMTASDDDKEEDNNMMINIEACDRSS
jgi:hypothetical protein